VSAPSRVEQSWHAPSRYDRFWARFMKQTAVTLAKAAALEFLGEGDPSNWLSRCRSRRQRISSRRGDEREPTAMNQGLRSQGNNNNNRGRGLSERG
jgi:hypothetical protein